MKKNIAIILIVGMFFSPHFCHAFWPADWSLNSALSEVLAKMDRMIEGAILGAQKQAALQAITASINVSISQGAEGGGPLWVTNWDEELFYKPIEQADLVMNDFFSDMTGGRGSIFDYQSVASAGYVNESTVGENYQKILAQEAQQATSDHFIPRCEITNASDMFTSGSWEKFNTIIGVDTCNQYGFTTISENFYASTVEKFEESAAVQGQAYGGWKPTTSGGTIITPGSTVSDIQAKLEGFGFDIIASATNPAEIITAVVTRLAGKTIRQGIGSAQQYVQKEINKVDRYNEQLKSQIPSRIYSPKY